MIFHRFHPKAEIDALLDGTYRSHEPVESYSMDEEYDLQEMGYDADEIEAMSPTERWEKVLDKKGIPYEAVVNTSTRGGSFKGLHVRFAGVFAYPGPGEDEYGIRPSSNDDYLVEFEGTDLHYQSIENEAIATVDKIISIKQRTPTGWAEVPKNKFHGTVHVVAHTRDNGNVHVTAYDRNPPSP